MDIFSENELWEIHITLKSSHVCRFNCRKEIYNNYLFYDARIRTERLCQQFKLLKRTGNLSYS
jgi:hypothetical protein